MKRMTLCLSLAVALGLGLGASIAHADSFTYHGTLQDAGEAANGSYDMKLTLYSDASGGTVLAGPVTVYGVNVEDGNFVTSVDFGALSLASQGWVAVEVKVGGGDFVALDARSPVAPEGSACPGSWTLDGNAGIPAGSYLGTADASTVYIRSNAGTVAQFNPNHSVGLAFPYSTAGDYSTAIGYNAGTVNEGSIVTGGHNDTTFTNSIRDTATNQVILVAQHGVGINTAKGPDGLALRDELTIHPSLGLPATNADLTFETATIPGYVGFNMSGNPGGYFALNGLKNVAGAVTYDTLMYFNYFDTTTRAYIAFNGATADKPIRVGYNSSNGNGAYLSSTGIWTNASSRTFKEAFASIDSMKVLEKLVAMPVSTWFYKGNHDDGKHMGPVAEDFASTFGLGSNEKYIGSVDESGVAFAAIQGLNRKLESENAQLKSTLDAVLARLNKLESRQGE